MSRSSYQYGIDHSSPLSLNMIERYQRVLNFSCVKKGPNLLISILVFLFEMEHLLTILTIPQWRKVRENGVIFIFLNQ